MLVFARTRVQVSLQAFVHHELKKEGVEA